MNFRFYIDPERGYPHIYTHDVVEEEVEDVLLAPVEDRVSRRGARNAIGRTAGGRYLRVIYLRDPEPGSVFVITAYELTGNALAAYRRRRRRSNR